MSCVRSARVSTCCVVLFASSGIRDANHTRLLRRCRGGGGSRCQFHFVRIADGFRERAPVGRLGHPCGNVEQRGIEIGHFVLGHFHLHHDGLAICARHRCRVADGEPDEVRIAGLVHFDLVAACRGARLRRARRLCRQRLRRVDIPGIRFDALFHLVARACLWLAVEHRHDPACLQSKHGLALTDIGDRALDDDDACTGRRRRRHFRVWRDEICVGSFADLHRALQIVLPQQDHVSKLESLARAANVSDAFGDLIAGRVLRLESHVRRRWRWRRLRFRRRWFGRRRRRGFPCGWRRFSPRLRERKRR